MSEHTTMKYSVSDLPGSYFPHLNNLENRFCVNKQNQDLKPRINDILTYAAYFWITAAVVNEVSEQKCDASETSYWNEFPPWVERPEDVLPMTKEAIRLRFSNFKITDDVLFIIQTTMFKKSIPELTETYLRSLVPDTTLKLVFKAVEQIRLQEIEDVQDTEDYKEFQEFFVTGEPIESHTPEEHLEVFDLDTQLVHTSTTVSNVLFDRLQKCVPQALRTLKITSPRKELALRGAKMFDYYYNKGIHQDVAALQIIEEDNLALKEAAIIKNMNKNFVQDRVLGAAGESAVFDIVVPAVAKPLGGGNEPDFIIEETKTIFEVKWRVNNSKARSAKWLIENECKYLYKYLKEGYRLILVYVLYAKERCEVQQWTLSPVNPVAP